MVWDWIPGQVRNDKSWREISPLTSTFGRNDGWCQNDTVLLVAFSFDFFEKCVTKLI